VIKTIRHKGLRRLFEQDDPSGVNSEHADKLRDILATLHAAPTVAHMDFTGIPVAWAQGPDEKVLGCDRSGQLASDLSL
jgi:proteic killer suppression protein